SSDVCSSDLSSAPRMAYLSPLAPPTPSICVATQRLSSPLSSSSVSGLNKPTQSSPTAASPDATKTPKVSATKRASIIPTSSSVVRRACPGQSSGKITRTSVEVTSKQQHCHTVIASRVHAIHQRRRQTRQVGALPAHHKAGLLAVRGVGHPFVGRARSPRQRGIGENREPAWAD